ncbi:MAG: hypothetical protein QOH10_2760, partial [Actinomycetota bacterium]|nr:hypothetical protein [Actinomycetota bacterium]
MSGVAPSALAAYLPRFTTEWDLLNPDARWRELDASLCFVDISGFTKLSERLARRGRVGAEELTEVLDNVFSRMLAVAYEKGGVLLKFGGDALLFAFDRDDHASLAVQSAVAMRAALRGARTLPTSVGRINLRMSTGVHTGPCHLFRVGSSHQELIVCGPGASTVARMEHTAAAGEILVSAATAQRLPARSVGSAKGDGFLLRTRTVEPGGPGPGVRAPVNDADVIRGLPVALRSYLAQGRAESAHRIATVAFIRFESVDELLVSAGPDGVADALDELMENVQDATAAEGVTFLATDADENAGKVILVSGVPEAHDDDEGRMLRTLRRIADRRGALPLRIGVNRGHVFACDVGTAFRRTFTIMGDSVNLAARLMAASRPGEVWATSSVLDRSHTLFDTEPIAPFPVKGKAELIQAYSVRKIAGARRAERSTLPYVGRAEPLARLEQLLDDARQHRGAVAQIEAERGAGKSRLIDEFRRAHPEISTVALQGEPYATATPYAPWREPLRALLGIGRDAHDASVRAATAVATAGRELVPYAPLLAPVLDVPIAPTPETRAIAPAFQRDRVAALLIAVLDALAPSPLLIVADDAHQFDDASADLGERIGAAALTRPWLLVVSGRPSLSGFRPTVVDAQLKLGPLDDVSANALVDAATDAAPMRPQERAGIVQRAAGNPLFLEELVRVARSSGFDALPESIDAVATAEIDALPPAARGVVRDASVLGTTFDPALLDEVLGDDRLPLDDVTRRQVGRFLRPDGETRVRFRHALLQEAAYESLPYRKRIELHRRAGEAIERRTADDDSSAASLLSLHF